jgi:PAS domain S-box-containing protein
LIGTATERDVVRVLIVDGHRDFAENLAELGRLNGLAPEICGSCATARARVHDAVFDVAIVDQRLPDGLGIELLADLRANCPDIVTIVVTAFVSLDDTLAALNQGAFAFMAKDSDPDELLAIIARAAENAKLRRENRELRDLHETILRALPDLLLLVDESMRIASVNQRHVVFCPCEPAEAVGRPLQEVVAPFLRQRLEIGELLREAHEKTGAIDRTVEVRDDSGRLWILGVRAIPLQTVDRPLMLLRVVDLTDRIELERQLTDAQHLATLGRLVSSIAHEVRNPLAGIRALAQLLQRRFKDAPNDHESVTEILGLTDRMHATLSDLLEFARPGGHRDETIDVAALVEALHGEAQRWPAASERRLEFVRRGNKPLQLVGAPRSRLRRDREPRPERAAGRAAGRPGAGDPRRLRPWLRDRRRGLGSGDRGRRPPAPVQAVLHHEDARHRTRALDRQEDRRGARRLDRGRTVRRSSAGRASGCCCPRGAPVAERRSRPLLRQVHGELGAAAGSGGDGEPPAVRLDEIAGDREPEAGAARNAS